jgi:hypothetical protein
MKTSLIIAVFTLLASSVLAAPDQSLDKELATLAEQLASASTNANIKKIATLDFTDLQGNPSELGRFIAEQVAVNMVMIKRSFAVVDRANLKRILEEHKLSMSGLVNPENTKKLGQFSGVDAIILGRITPMADSVAISATITLTETAEVVGGAKIRISKSQDVQQLLEHSVQTVTQGEDKTPPSSETQAKVERKFENFTVQVQSLRILNGKDYILSLNFTNQNQNKTVYVALECEGPVAGALKSSVEDPQGFQFISYEEQVTGLAVGSWSFMGWNGGVKKIAPHNSATATVKFVSNPPRAASPGKCNVQLALFDVTLDGYGRISNVTKCNLACELVVQGQNDAK